MKSFKYSVQTTIEIRCIMCCLALKILNYVLKICSEEKRRDEGREGKREEGRDGGEEGRKDGGKKSENMPTFHHMHIWKHDYVLIMERSCLIKLSS